MPKAPDFWARKPGCAAALLTPFGVVWDAAGRVRRGLSRPYFAPVPVVCVGNLLAGGAGKTPVALAIVKWLTAQGVVAAMVTRGYGGRLAGPCRVDAVHHAAGDVGDEALLLAAHAPTWVARDRALGIAAAIMAGAEIVLLDDGFQNPSVAKTLSLVVVDAAYGFGNGRVMPAGPLRENRDRGMARADAVVLLATVGEKPLISAQELGDRQPVLAAALQPIAGERFAGERIFAFSGIGRPARFFATLSSLGAEIVTKRSFPDHHQFSDCDIAMLRAAARRTRAQLVTTAKDFVRLPAAMRAGIEVLQVEISWPDPERLAHLLGPIVRAARRHADPELPAR